MSGPRRAGDPTEHGEPREPGELGDSRGVVLRIYRRLARLYPPDFRAAYGSDLVRNAADRAAEDRYRGVLGGTRLALFLLGDLLGSVPREWLRHRTRGRAMGREGTMHGTRDGNGRTGSGAASLLGELARDARFALRGFRRRPGFALGVILTLAVGIGATTVIVGVVDRVALRPLPYEAADRLVQIGGGYPDWSGLSSISPAEYHRWRERTGTLDDVVGSRLQSFAWDPGEGPVIVGGAGVSAGFFDLLGVSAWRGRVFTEAEDRLGEPGVAVLTHGAWTRRWGADPSVIGATVRLSGRPVTVVGVLPPSFTPPEAIYHGFAELYVPLSYVDDDVSPTASSNHFLQALGRLAPGATLDAARADLAAIQQELFDEIAAPAERSVRVEPLHERTVGDFGRAMLPFLAAVAFLLLVACANAAHLFLVRAAERGLEVRIRRSLGAGRRRLARQLLTESTLLCLLAALLGGVLAWGGVELFRALAPPSIPRAAEVAVDLRVLAVAASLGLATGVLFGLVPALRLLGAPSAPGTRTSGGSGGTARGRGMLLVGEVAVALTLFIGAGLLANSFLRLLGTDLGFEPERAAYALPFPDGERYETAEGRLAFMDEVTAAVARTPGVEAVGWTNNPPLYGNTSTQNVTIDGWTADGDDGPDVSWHRVTPGLFDALGADLVAGRDFTRADDGSGTGAVIVNEAFARAYWDVPAAGALGRRLHPGDRTSERPWLEVVGVVADIRHHNPAEAPIPELYIPYRASPASSMALVARAAGGEPAGIVADLRRAIRDADPDAPVRGEGPYRSLVASAVLTPRFQTSLLGAFAGVALLLALMGVYATMAYSVRQRRHELGVRMALGAAAEQVQAMVLGRGLALTGVGIALGVGLSLVGTRLLEGMVYGVTPTDPGTFAAASVFLAAAAAAACWIPARRATRVDPVETLRSE